MIEKMVSTEGIEPSTYWLRVLVERRINHLARFALVEMILCSGGVANYLRIENQVATTSHEHNFGVQSTYGVTLVRKTVSSLAEAPGRHLHRRPWSDHRPKAAPLLRRSPPFECFKRHRTTRNRTREQPCVKLGTD